MLPVLCCFQAGLLLLVHGEVTDPDVDFFDREKVFIETKLKPLLDKVGSCPATLPTLPSGTVGKDGRWMRADCTPVPTACSTWRPARRTYTAPTVRPVCRCLNCPCPPSTPLPNLQVPELRVVMEHITTRDAAEFVASAPANVAASVTPQHLLLNRNALFVGGLRPHAFCLPILKREEHRAAVAAAATSGSRKFFLGTDSGALVGTW